MTRYLGNLAAMIILIAVSFYIYTPLGVCSIMAAIWRIDHLLGLKEKS